MSPKCPTCRNLIVVACHAPFKETIETVPEHPEHDDAWVLQPFQRGEPPLYIEHIRRGIALLRNDPAALLIFSGGFTRQEAGLRWSEAATYAAIARHFDWWTADADERREANLESRIATEDFSRDSFENLLFSFCRFEQILGRYPQTVTIVSWAFKEARFDWHRAALRFPSGRFHFAGCGQPLILETALAGEAITFAEFTGNKYGSRGTLIQKRVNRNPFNRQHAFGSCSGMEKFFEFIIQPENGQKDFTERLPWEG